MSFPLASEQETLTSTHANHRSPVVFLQHRNNLERRKIKTINRCTYHILLPMSTVAHVYLQNLSCVAVTPIPNAQITPISSSLGTNTILFFSASVKFACIRYLINVKLCSVTSRTPTVLVQHNAFQVHLCC